MKKLVVIVAIVGTTWLASFISVTLWRTDCIRPLNARCNDGILQAYGDFVQLGWVYSFQTLLAGVLAVGAGGFVYLTAVNQRKWAAEDTHRGQVRRYKAMMLELLEVCFRCRNAYQNGHRDMRSTTLPTIEFNKAALADFNPAIAAVFVTLAHECDHGLQQLANRPPDGGRFQLEDQNEGVRFGFGCLAAMWHFLLKADSFDVEDGKALIDDVDPASLIEELKGVDLEFLDIPLAPALFSAPA